MNCMTAGSRVTSRKVELEGYSLNISGRESKLPCIQRCGKFSWKYPIAYKACKGNLTDNRFKSLFVEVFGLTG